MTFNGVIVTNNYNRFGRPRRNCSLATHSRLGSEVSSTIASGFALAKSSVEPGRAVLGLERTFIMTFSYYRLSGFSTELTRRSSARSSSRSLIFSTELNHSSSPSSPDNVLDSLDELTALTYSERQKFTLYLLPFTTNDSLSFTMQRQYLGEHREVFFFHSLVPTFAHHGVLQTSIRLEIGSPEHNCSHYSVTGGCSCKFCGK